jgi:hypothetical protein
MTRAKLFTDFLVIARPLIFVSDQQANGRARCLALENTRQNLDLIQFPPLAGVPGPTGPASVKILLNVAVIQ